MQKKKKKRQSKADSIDGTVEGVVTCLSHIGLVGLYGFLLDTPAMECVFIQVHHITE